MDLRGKSSERESNRLEKEAEREEEIKEEELMEIVKTMKKRKAPGIDEISIEAWIYGGKAVRKGLTDIISQTWKEKKNTRGMEDKCEYSNSQKRRNEAENYRGISLLCTAYKIYTELLRKRLEEKIERRLICYRRVKLASGEEEEH